MLAAKFMKVAISELISEPTLLSSINEDDFCKHLRNLHLTQVVEAAPDAEAGDPRHSILTACMSDGHERW